MKGAEGIRRAGADVERIEGFGASHDLCRASVIGDNPDIS